MLLLVACCVCMRLTDIATQIKDIEGTISELSEKKSQVDSLFDIKKVCRFISLYTPLTLSHSFMRVLRACSRL